MNEYSRYIELPRNWAVKSDLVRFLCALFKSQSPKEGEAKIMSCTKVARHGYAISSSLLELSYVVSLLANDGEPLGKYNKRSV